MSDDLPLHKKLFADMVAVSEPTMAQLEAGSKSESGRGQPFGEMQHIFGGFRQIYPLALMHSADLNMVMKFLNMGAAKDGEDSILMDRLKEWEKKVDFAKAGWEGQKPSEMIATLVEMMKTFVKENPNLAALGNQRGSGQSIA